MYGSRISPASTQNAVGQPVQTAGNSGAAGNAGLYRIVTASGNPLIDGLLSGVAWKFNTISVAYPTNGASYGFNYGNGENLNFSPFTSAQRLVSDFALSLLADFTQIALVNGTESGANLRFGQNLGTNSNIVGYYPDGFGTMGDVWIGTRNGNAGNGDIGSFAYATILHELGHALGLKHGQDIGIGDDPKTSDNVPIPRYAPLPAVNDHWNYSLMTYRSFQGAAPEPVQGGFVSDNPTSYMMADIAAFQYMYGANYSGFSSTSTLYQWNAAGDEFRNGSLFLPKSANGKVFETIWDGGGVDTYDFSNFSTNQVIDLRPGAFSTFDPGKLADLDKNNPGTRFALGNIANALLVNNDLRSLIENANAGSGNDTLIGNQIGNVLNGGAGNDTLDGGAGADTLIGGLGDDVHVVDVSGDVVTELAGQGTDTVYFAGNGMTQYANVEIGRLTGLATTLIGSNVAGDILVTNPGGGSSLFGQGGNDELWGSFHADTLNGGANDDVLRSGGGADNLIGGTGNDHFIVDNAGALIFEDIGGGSDTAWVTVNDYVLAPNVEVARLAAPGAYRIFGSNGGEDIVANQSFASVIDGQGGNDTLWGSGGADVLNGNVGDDVLRSQGGADQLYGGDGNDAFVVFDNGAVIIEGNGASSGYDTLWLSTPTNTAYTVGANVERINLSGPSTVVTGNDQDNLIVGNPGAGNNLNGAGGNDTIFGTAFADLFFGGAGNDILYSQGGADIFRFSAGFGFDQISGFVQGQARIDFSGMGLSYGALSFQFGGGNTQVTVGGDRVLVYGVTSLNPGDFIF